MRHRQAIAAAFVASLLGPGIAHAQDSDRVQGTGRELKGTVEKGVGNLTGNQKLTAQGQSDKTSGELQDAWGKFKDSVRDIAASIENKFSGK
jgi:uncharacterized protein YjbJ (UPF0337 family)